MLDEAQREWTRVEARRRWRAIRHLPQNKGNGHDAWRELHSTGAEVTVSYMLGLPPKRVVGDGKDGDLANGDEVRQTKWMNGQLQVWPEDPPERRYWLVVGKFPIYSVRGWLFGAQAFVYERRHLDGRTSHAGPPHVVPQSDLRPVIG